MLFARVILFTLVVSISIFNICNAGRNNQQSVAHNFSKLSPAQTVRCLHIKSDFHKLKGHWYYVLRTVKSKRLPRIRCGYLDVHTVSMNGFDSYLTYTSSNGSILQFPVTGSRTTETSLEIVEMPDLISGTPDELYTNVEIGICDNDSLFFIKSLHYLGGMMTFTRSIPQDIEALQRRFKTDDERRGKEYTIRVLQNCSNPHGNNWYNVN